MGSQPGSDSAIRLMPREWVAVAVVTLKWPFHVPQSQSSRFDDSHAAGDPLQNLPEETAGCTSILIILNTSDIQTSLPRIEL